VRIYKKWCQNRENFVSSALIVLKAMFLVRQKLYESRCFGSRVHIDTIYAHRGTVVVSLSLTKNSVSGVEVKNEGQNL